MGFIGLESEESKNTRGEGKAEDCKGIGIELEVNDSEEMVAKIGFVGGVEELVEVCVPGLRLHLGHVLTLFVLQNGNL